VLAQSPTAGQLVKRGSTVTVFVSTGAVSVPSVIGQTRRSAVGALKRAGFSPAGVDDWRFVWPCAGDAKLELDAAAVRFELAGRGIDTRFGRQETYTLHGEQTASAAMARVLLTNSVEDYDDAMEA
jgi:hypothetical protein